MRCSNHRLACRRLLLPALVLATSVGAAPLGADAAAGAARSHDALPRALARALDAADPVLLASARIPRLASLDAAQRSTLASRLDRLGVPERVASYAFLQVGTPYRLGPLGEEAAPDTDGVIVLDATDCTALNLVSTALAHAREAGGERAAMAIANYRGGEISYATRFHFTTDRLDSCRWFADITARVGGDSCRRRTVALNRRAGGGRWIDIEWSRDREVVYVPRGFGTRLAREYDAGRIPAAMGIAFVQESKLADGLDVVHESLLWKGRTLLHASSASGRVITVPWDRFLAEQGARYDGFVLFEYR